MAEVHTLLLAHGKEVTLFASEVDRAVVEAAAAYLSSEDTDIGYLFSGWAQAALPHRRLPGRYGLAGHYRPGNLDCAAWPPAGSGGTPVSVGVPYGSRARLILLYLQTEAVRTNSREVELGRSLHAWLRRLEIPIGGKQMASVRDQAERISRCRLSFQIKQGTRTGFVNQHILDTSMFIEDENAQGGLFVEKASLSQSFFEELKKHPVPVEEAAVRQIANNSLALDVYCWLAYRLHSLQWPDHGELEGPPRPIRALRRPARPLQGAFPDRAALGDQRLSRRKCGGERQRQWPYPSPLEATRRWPETTAHIRVPVKISPAEKPSYFNKSLCLCPR